LPEYRVTAQVTHPDCPSDVWVHVLADTATNVSEIATSLIAELYEGATIKVIGLMEEVSFTEMVARVRRRNIYNMQSPSGRSYTGFTSGGRLFLIAGGTVRALGVAKE
jgi:hypothetical protein